MSAKNRNIELEQVILGIVLLDNDTYHKISNTVRAEYFFDPVHQDIWRNISGRISKDHLASPVTLKSDFENHAGLQQLGGPAYLARLAGASISKFAILDYANDLAKLYRRRRVVEILQKATNDANDGADISSVISEAEVDLSVIGDQSGKEASLSLQRVLMSAIEGMAKGYKEGIPQGILTGLDDLDKMTSGFHAPDFVILAGRPSMGKTSLATSIALRVARQDVPVGVVSLEMSPEGLAHRILSEVSGVNYFAYRQAHKMNEGDFKKTVLAAKEIENLPLDIVPSHIRDVGGILSSLKSVSRKYKSGLGLVIIDYLQLASGKGYNDTARVSELSRQFKHMARLLNCPVLALAQLSRGVESREDKRPMLSDLRDSGQIEQDADAVLFCYRDYYYLSRERPAKKVADQADQEAAKAASKNIMEIIVAKQRMGPIGKVTLGCSIANNRFWNSSETEAFF